MTTTTLLLLLLSLLCAAALSFYQYYYKAGQRSKITIYLAVLRFLAIFGILLLLINPVISHNSYEIEKTPLPIVIDNSASVKDLQAGQAAREVYSQIISNKALRQKFDLQTFRFDSEVVASDTFRFDGKQTNIDKVAQSLKDLFRHRTFPTVLLTDGNQTSGSDYVYDFNPQNKVYPVVLGDTTTFLDLKISRLNANKYAFYKNKFPVEVFLQYSGNKAVSANFSIARGNTVYEKQTVSFSPSKRSAVLNVLLPADKTGLQVFRASLNANEQEKNTYNNFKNFAVEIIDQKTEVALVSSISHPDIGALKRAIESNLQRKVTVVKPKDVNILRDFNVMVFYQPNGDFKTLFEGAKNAGINTFVITGKTTDFQFLNANQSDLVFKMSAQSEDYLAAFNPQFNLFAADDFGFDHLPPLQNAFGSVTPGGKNDVLLYSRIRNINTNAPLLTFAENQGRRSAYLLGENIWKWRLQDYVEHQNFNQFDLFADKIIQFLASGNRRKSLVVNHEGFYNSGDAIEISAQFFNKNYEFDEKARLSIAVTNKATRQTKNYELLKSNNSYKVNLDGLAAGAYNFTVRENNSKTSYSGYFEILDFDIEKQFVNPDLGKLNQLASQTSGAVWMPDQTEQLIRSLLDDAQYQAIQKAVVKKSPLIDWVWLLVLIAALLSAEWFLRKYHGML